MKHFQRYYLVCFLIVSLVFACNRKFTEQYVIRVGTTGDYPPLTSYDTSTRQFSGDDIDLALRLGKHLRKRVVFVKTTWKTLNTDMQAKKFDIAVGGISVNAARKKSFIFSDPLLMDRKVAVFLLANRTKFQDFTAIDQPGVRIIENIGGTNEQFAIKNIQHATLQVIPDNQQVFLTLLKSGADVMFTDETEARYQQKKHQELFWIRMDEKISPSYAKAILFNQTDTVLQQRVNKWLKEKQ